MKSKFWLDLGLNGAECIDLSERPELLDSILMFGNDFQPIGWTHDNIHREDGLTVHSWLKNNCEYFNISDKDPEVLKFISIMVNVGVQNVTLVEVVWDEESVLVMKY